jgi:hypothetical protein
MAATLKTFAAAKVTHTQSPNPSLPTQNPAHPIKSSNVMPKAEASLR